MVRDSHSQSIGQNRLIQSRTAEYASSHGQTTLYRHNQTAQLMEESYVK